MRSFTVSIIPLYLLAGLVAAAGSSIPADFEGSTTGRICCDMGTAAPDKICKSFNLNSFCCGPYKADTKRKGKGQSGCDPFGSTFPKGREVLFVDPIDKTCTAGGAAGFIGCA
ncbi:hypothetical protein PspLS_03080 [Pyricularia sp. CBS 133598]|nr:hypothetical protein PspLS_03080 [Pyricularia sp. CBS 133598]